MKSKDCKFPEIKREYEALHLQEGSLLMNGFYGRPVRIKKPPRIAEDLLLLCDGRTSSETIFEELRQQYSEVELEIGRKFLSELIRMGIVAESLWSLRPSDISVELFQRFETEIAALQKEETAENSAFDYFRRLREAKITIIGAGGNGSIGAMMLAAAGIGALHIVDGDFVSESNLVRQIFYTESEAREKKQKVHALSERLANISSYTKVTVDPSFIHDSADVERHIQGSTCVLLCADAPRFKINQWVDIACKKQNVPYINILSGLVGPLTVPGVTPCFECLQVKYRKALGPIHDQIVSALQKERSFQYPSFVTGVVNSTALLIKEVVQFITGTARPQTLDGVLRYIDGRHRLEKFESDERCPACSKNMEAPFVQTL